MYGNVVDVKEQYVFSQANFAPFLIAQSLRTRTFPAGPYIFQFVRLPDMVVAAVTLATARPFPPCYSILLA